jgi:2-oxoglutarate ferredoxin oxidoreductase subunit gamma
VREEVIIAGFGGQGVMLAGQVLAYAGMLEGKHVTWLPSYGPEVRGGTANCTVVISDRRIGSVITPSPHSVIVMNRPSLDRFEPVVKPGGLLIVNSSIIDRKPSRGDIAVWELPVAEVAEQLGDARVANMVVLGAYVARTKVVGMERLLESLDATVPGHRRELIELDRRAIMAGRDMCA